MSIKKKIVIISFALFIASVIIFFPLIKRGWYLNTRTKHDNGPKYSVAESFRKMDSIYLVLGKVFPIIDTLKPNQIINGGKSKVVYQEFIKNHPGVPVNVWSYKVLMGIYFQTYKKYVLDYIENEDPWMATYSNACLYWPVLDTNMTRFDSLSNVDLTGIKENLIYNIRSKAELLTDFDKNPYIVVLYPFINGTTTRIGDISKDTRYDYSSRVTEYKTLFSSTGFDGLWVVVNVKDMKVVWAVPIQFGNSDKIEMQGDFHNKNIENEARDAVGKDLKKHFGQKVFTLYKDSLGLSEEAFRINDADAVFYR